MHLLISYSWLFFKLQQYGHYNTDHNYSFSSTKGNQSYTTQTSVSNDTENFFQPSAPWRLSQRLAQCVCFEECFDFLKTFRSQDPVIYLKLDAHKTQKRANIHVQMYFQSLHRTSN